MKYPTEDQVNIATKIQLGTWLRFLPSPGITLLHITDLQKFEEESEKQLDIINLIYYKFYTELGGWTPELSKTIGWEKK